jgi:uncharacterized protein YjbJ (UPF0337 family)
VPASCSVTRSQADQVEGKLQNSWGSMKDEARETLSRKDDADNS